MLAGPRRKQKIVNLRGGNSAWSDDSGKFGQRMLERMGWSRGKGLGAREDGVVTHVVARYKNDEHGLGYDERSDQWTRHEDQFSKLLADLSGGGNGEEKISTDNGQIISHSGVSLEVKSKKSRARVHYHKFARGKDLSRYSEKDLANIFGKKSLRAADGDATPGEDTFNRDDVQKTTQMLKICGNMDDYFNGKLQALGRSTLSAPISRDQSPEHVFRGFAGVSSHSDTEATDVDVPVVKFSFYKTKIVSDIKDVTLNIKNENCDRKKKKNKHEHEESATIDNTSTETCDIKTGESDCKNVEKNEPMQLSSHDYVNVEKIKKKKSKKPIQAEEVEPDVENRRDEYECNENVYLNLAKIKKEKSKKKPTRAEKDETEEDIRRDEYECNENVDLNLAKIKKEKSKKKPTRAEKDETEEEKRRDKYKCSQHVDFSLEKTKKKKSKNRPTSSAEKDETEEEKKSDVYVCSQNVDFNLDKTKKKKRKKKPAYMHEVEQEKRDEGEDDTTANTSMKSKRKAADDNAVLSENSHDRKKRKKEKKSQIK